MSVVRRMTEADIAHVVAVQEESFEGDAGSSRLSESDLRAELGRGWARLWVFADPIPTGFLLIWHVADEMHVHNVAVHPSHRRRGIARALMRQAEEYVREFGVARAFLEVRRSNVAARALYEAHGYRVTGERAHYYTDGEDALEMAWEA